jgi:hypothetical protein
MSLYGDSLLLFAMWFGMVVFVLPFIAYDIVKNALRRWRK